MRARQYKAQQYNDARFSSITCCTSYMSQTGPKNFTPQNCEKYTNFDSTELSLSL